LIQWFVIRALLGIPDPHFHLVRHDGFAQLRQRVNELFVLNDRLLHVSPLAHGPGNIFGVNPMKP
jgi:hypothetical protein